MDTNQNKIREIEERLEKLLEKAKGVSSEIKEIAELGKEKSGALSAEVDKCIADIEKVCLELDEADRKAEEDLDLLLMERSEEIARGE